MTDGKVGFNGSFEAYRNWIRTAMEQNMPWDDFTNSLLSSRGDGWDPKTAAVGYYTRDRGMPLDNLANSMRVFLGSRMECAQCHDDPFGETERHDFYELAAFTEGQGALNQGYMSKLWDELGEDDRRRSLDYDVAQVMWDRVYGLSLGGTGAGHIKLPEDYQYRDGEPGQMVGAKTPFGNSVRISEKSDKGHGRQELAEWVTTKTGEQFASVAANRMWKRVMGRGVYEPVDEFKPAKELHHPDLMNMLNQLMVDLDYDLRGFQKVLLNTKTFQFVPNPEPAKVLTGDDFHGRQLTRLSAEQLWDSLITLASGDPDKTPRRSLDDRIYVSNKPVLVGKKNMPQLSKEVLALKSEEEVRAYFTTFLADVRKERGGSANDGGGMMMENKIHRYGNDSPVRASELPSPAPRQHLLYLFGQSDRLVVDGASREPNVGQVLSLMNGYVQKQLVNNSGASLYKSLAGAGTDEEKVRRLYITILSRPPSPEEMGWMIEEVKASGEDGYRNIVSALVMLHLQRRAPLSRRQPAADVRFQRGLRRAGEGRQGDSQERHLPLHVGRHEPPRHLRPEAEEERGDGAERGHSDQRHRRHGRQVSPEDLRGHGQGLRGQFNDVPPGCPRTGNLRDAHQLRHAWHGKAPDARCLGA